MVDREQLTGPPPELFSLSQIRHLMRVEFSRAQRYGYPLACLVLSIDGLEAHREEHGYEAIETALAQVTGLLQAETRVCDYLGRLAHDELVAVLPHTDADGARITAARLVQRTHSASAGLTISVGGAVLEDENALFFDALLETAEAAARAAQELGGDRVEFHASGAPAAAGGEESGVT